MRKERGNYFRTCMEDNLERRNIGKHVTPADKIRMALRSFAKDLNISAIEPESSIGKMSDSFIQKHLFAWNNLGNAKNRTEEQEHLLKLKILYCIVKPGALPGLNFIDSRESKGIALPDLF